MDYLEIYNKNKPTSLKYYYYYFKHYKLYKKYKKFIKKQGIETLLIKKKYYINKLNLIQILKELDIISKKDSETERKRTQYKLAKTINNYPYNN